MKRLTKLSLATVLSLTTCTSMLNANDTISEALADSKVKGEIKAAYVDSNFLGLSKSDNSLVVGGSINFITGDYKGLNAGVTFQAATVLSDDLNYSNNGPFSVNGVSKRTSFFDASGSVLSESYLEYTISNTTLKGGRQFIHTPLVNNALEGKSSDAVIKDSFEAYLLTNKDIPNTTLVAGYIDKWQAQSNGSGDIADFEDIEDGAYTLYVKNNSIDNLTLQAQYLDIKGTTSANDKDIIYLQADYQAGAHTISGQYYASTDKSQASNAQDGKLFALKATGPLGLGKLGYLIGYSSSLDKNAPVYTGIGAGETDTVFTALPVHDGGVPSRPDTDTLVGALVAPIGPVTLIGYAGKSMSSTHPIGDVTGTGAMVIYPISKNFQLRVNYEHVAVEKLITEGTDTTRVYLSYKF